MGRWMGETMGGALTKPSAKIATILFFAAIAAGGFAGCALMQIDADVNDFIPGGSYLKEWISDSNSLFRSLGDGINVFTREFDVTTEENANTLLAASLVRCHRFCGFLDRGVQRRARVHRGVHRV